METLGGAETLEVASSPPSESPFHSLPPEMDVIKCRPNPNYSLRRSASVLTGAGVRRHTAPVKSVINPPGMNPALALPQEAGQHQGRRTNSLLGLRYALNHYSGKR